MLELRSLYNNSTVLVSSECRISALTNPSQSEPHLWRWMAKKRPRCLHLCPKLEPDLTYPTQSHLRRCPRLTSSPPAHPWRLWQPRSLPNPYRSLSPRRQLHRLTSQGHHSNPARKHPSGSPRRALHQGDLTVGPACCHSGLKIHTVLSFVHL